MAKLSELLAQEVARRREIEAGVKPARSSLGKPSPGLEAKKQATKAQEAALRGRSLTGRPYDGRDVPLEEKPVEVAPIPSAASIVEKSSRDEVLEWVGDDKQNARAALEVEEARPKPRKTLVAALRKLV